MAEYLCFILNFRPFYAILADKLQYNQFYRQYVSLFFLGIDFVPIQVLLDTQTNRPMAGTNDHEKQFRMGEKGEKTYGQKPTRCSI